MSSDVSSSQTGNSQSILPKDSPFFNTFIRTSRVQVDSVNGGLPVGRKRKSNGAVLYTCTRCPSWSHGNRRAANDHVGRKHAVDGQSPGFQRSISSMLPPMASPDVLRTSFNQQRYKEAIVGLLTRRRVPFSAVEWSELRDLALACNPAIEDLLITSRRTVVRLIMANYDFYYNQIKTSLSFATSPIHIATDLWTSPHRHSMLAVCAQWVDSNFELQKALLGLPECRFDHSGKHQADLILNVLERFEIQQKIGFHTGDNATSNDTCLEAIGKVLTANGIEFNHSKRRIRCIGHIINLSLQAFLTASSSEAVQAALAATADVAGEDLLTRFTEVLSLERRPRPAQTSGRQKRRGSRGSMASDSEDIETIGNLPTLRKLHSLAVWIRSSSIHADLWDQDVSLRLGIDNATRWSSWYTVIDRALRKKSSIVQFMTDHEVALGANRLNAHDWNFLGKAHQFLQPFTGSTLYAEGDKSSISQSLVLMDALLLHYEQQKVIYSQPDSTDEKMLHAIDMGWFIIDKYYSKTEEAPVYAAALLLDPARRAAYIEQNWPDSWYSTSIESACAIWNEEYKRNGDPDTPPMNSTHDLPSRASPPPKRPRNQLDTLFDSLKVKKISHAGVDDFMTFITADPIDIEGMTPLEWWCESEQRRRYPRLSRMAIAILSIPAESTEPERTFSGARRTCSWDRLRLSCANIEMIECIASWLHEGHIKPLHLNGLGLPVGEGEDQDEIEIELVEAVNSL